MASREPRAAFQLYREARTEAARMASFPQAASVNSTADNGDWTVALGNARVPVGQFPAKWTDDPFAPVTLANCNSDYVVFGLNAAGSATQANLIAFNNLYSSPTTPALCGLQPLPRFAYNVSTVSGGVVRTSPVISLDGKKIAFIESVTASTRTILHVLNVPLSNPSPGFPQGGSAINAVVPPPGAMTSLTISNSSTDTRSSPWIDYNSDTVYVGSDNGRVYKITGVFKGTPTLAGAPWPKVIAANQRLTSPVFDDVTNKLFVGAFARIYSVSADNVSTTVTTLNVGTSTALNSVLLDAPIIDSTAGTLLSISSNDSTLLNSAVVVQASTSSLAEIRRLSIGQGSTGGTAVDLYGGDFDNAYFNNPATGHMLICGTAPTNTTPTLYSVSFNAAAQMTTITQLSAVATNSAARCGPITEFYNANIAGGTDFFFFGVTRNCSVGTGVGNGCLMSRRTTGGVTTTIAAPARAGTSGIIPDNNSPQLNASSIYFSTEETNALAVKLTQQGLN
jgi:hypothetical protein